MSGGGLSYIKCKGCDFFEVVDTGSYECGHKIMMVCQVTNETKELKNCIKDIKDKER